MAGSCSCAFSSGCVIFLLPHNYPDKQWLLCSTTFHKEEKRVLDELLAPLLLLQISHAVHMHVNDSCLCFQVQSAPLLRIIHFWSPQFSYYLQLVITNSSKSYLQCENEWVFEYDSSFFFYFCSVVFSSFSFLVIRQSHVALLPTCSWVSQSSNALRIAFSSSCHYFQILSILSHCIRKHDMIQ